MDGTTSSIERPRQSYRCKQQKFIPRRKETMTMLVRLKTLLTVLMVASLPVCPGAEPQSSSNEPPRRKSAEPKEKPEPRPIIWGCLV